MVGQGSRQGTAQWIELLPEALVVAAQMAKESWGLPLAILATFPANGGGESPRKNPDAFRIMSDCISELSPHASTLLIKIWLVMSHAARDLIPSACLQPAALAASIRTSPSFAKAAAGSPALTIRPHSARAVPVLRRWET